MNLRHLNIMNYHFLIVLILSASVGFFGCAERDEELASPGSTVKADEALKNAESSLESAGILMKFDDPGQLAEPEKLVPDLISLARSDKQKNLEDAISQLNIVIAELEQNASPAPSLSMAPVGSISDRAMVHFYLGLSYLLDALSRLLISDDPEETFIIRFHPELNPDQWFEFGISDKVEARINATRDPLEYPLAFAIKERQAIIDAVNLISDAEVKPRSSSIQPQSTSVNRPPYTNSALWHFEKAIALFSQYNPDIKEALDDFNYHIDKLESLLNKDSSRWGFIYTPASWR